MSIGCQEDVEGLEAAGRVVAETLAAMEAAVRPGITTVADGTRRVVSGSDGWTVLTAGGRLAAHFEHTIVVTCAGARVLTAT